MKFYASLLALLMVFNVHGAQIKCSGLSIMAASDDSEDPIMVDVEVVDNRNMIFNGIPLEITEIKSAKFNNLDGFIKCQEHDDWERQDECEYDFFGSRADDDYYRFLFTERLAIVDFEEMAQETDPEFSIDWNKIASAKKYFAGEMSKFGAPGLTEFYDSKGKLLARYFSNVEYFRCR